ncbi:hypothetical protein FJZ31_39660 [Candidatus Poribacteria bacterium]|nr:hypothetical protein [Candidatus Poribacteria bacterium]
MSEIINYVKDYLAQQGHVDLAKYVEWICRFLGWFLTVGLSGFLLKGMLTRVRKRFQQRRLNKDLHPFYTLVHCKINYDKFDFLNHQDTKTQRKEKTIPSCLSALVVSF